MGLWLSWKKSYRKKGTELDITSKQNSRILEGHNKMTNMQKEMQKARNKKAYRVDEA